MQPPLLMVAMLAAIGVAPAQQGQPQRPMRIVSTNVCADQWAQLLVEPERIVALSRLSTDPLLSNDAVGARRFRQIGARAEEIVPLNPDMVLANAWTGASANRFLNGLGIKVLIVPDAANFAEIEKVLFDLAEALDATGRANTIAAHFKDRLRRASRPPTGQTVLIYEPNGYTPSRGTLSDAIVTAAGLRNLAPDLGVPSYGTVALERVVMARPDILVLDDHAPSLASRAQALLHHPALKEIATRAQRLSVPARTWLCAGPWSVEALEHLVKPEHRP